MAKTVIGTQNGGRASTSSKRKVQPIVIVVDRVAHDSAMARQDTTALGSALGWSEDVDGARSVDEAAVSIVARGSTHLAFLYSMAAFGIFHPMRFANVGGGKRRLLLAAYSLGVLALLSVTVIRMSITYFLPTEGSSESALTSNLPAFLLKMTMYCWKLQTAVVTAIFFAKFWSRGGGGLASYYAKLNAVADELASAGVLPDMASERRFEIACLASAWLAFVANGGYAVRYVVLSLSDADKSLLRWSIYAAPVNASNGTATGEAWRGFLPAACIESLSVLYGSGSGVFGVFYVLMVCRQVYTLLESFNRHLDHETAARPHVFLRSVGDYRRMHWAMCDVIATANACVAQCVGVHISTNFATSMMQAYLIATSGSSRDWPTMRVSIAVWLASAIAIIGAEFAACCLVTEKVQECEEYLERIPYTRSNDTDCEQLVQLQLFLNQIKRDRGFSIFGVYPITRDSILPLIGTWITYFLIIAQYSSQADSSSSGAAMNISCSA